MLEIGLDGIDTSTLDDYSMEIKKGTQWDSDISISTAGNTVTLSSTDLKEAGYAMFCFLQ